MTRKTLIPGSFFLFLALAGGAAGVAQTSSIEVTSSGFVGVGTAAPQSELHVRGTDPAVANTKLLVENAAGTSLQRELFELRNNGGMAFIFEDTTVPERWAFASFINSFVINNQANAGVEYNFGPTGSLVIAGNLTANGVFYPSSRVLKDDFQAVDGREVLARLAALPVSEWRYRSDPAASRHIGPVAEDFHSAFGLGAEGTGLNVGDVAGVTIAAVQGLWTELQEQKAAAEDQGKTLAELHQVLEEQRLLIERLRARLESTDCTE
jgi:endosialidase-like protein